MDNQHAGLLRCLFRHGHLQVPFKMETGEILWHPRYTKNVDIKGFTYCYYIDTTLRPCQGGSHVARLNFKTSRVGVYKCLSLIVGFAVTVAIWPREVVSCRDFILRAVTTFWAMTFVGIYPGRAPTFYKKLMIKINNIISIFKTCFGPESIDRNSNILKFFSHTKDTHRHSILCHCVS